MHRNINTIVLPLLLTATTSAFAQSAPIAKQLAGPPSEFSSMQSAKPIDSAIHSKSALLPIQLSNSAKGVWSWQTELPVDGDNLQMLVFSDNTENWNISMRSPAGFRSQPVDTLTLDSRKTSFGISDENYPADRYQFGQLAKGTWELSIESSNPGQQQGLLMISSDSPQRMLAYPSANGYVAGSSIGFVAHAYSEDRSLSSVNDVSINITSPDGSKLASNRMFDDGLHNDGSAGDGVYGGDFYAASAGNYNVQVVMRGSSNGLPFIRTTEHLVPVIASDLQISTETAYTTEHSDQRLMINLPIDSYSDAVKYRVFAEIWGRSNQNTRQKVPVSWVGGMVTSENGMLRLGLDTRWIASAQAVAPFELRNLRIEDPDHFITLAKARSMALTTPVLPESATRAFNGVVDQEMLMGPAPALANRGSGSRLLLVHGYCSGNVWGPVAGQFTGESIFMDLNQNRSHDQFAIRIHNFGSAYNSYGIVAHSQGGAAATHLYTYYWSGLDFASGGRLIQSVGTPYQGTALAGNLAAIGAIFGVGCGSNTDLTYNGAASWLSGIPSWARSAVNYYSTSFTDVWWRFDYCHLATDFLLSDPEDGTTERAYAQLPGAVNRGHKTGWCHTSGMRDPAQTTDSSRNSTMNSTAAR